MLKRLQQHQLSQRVKLDAVPIVKCVLFRNFDCDVRSVTLAFSKCVDFVVWEEVFGILQKSCGLLMIVRWRLAFNEFYLWRRLRNDFDMVNDFLREQSRFLVLFEILTQVHSGKAPIPDFFNDLVPGIPQASL